MASTRRSEQLLILVTFLLATACSVFSQDGDEEPVIATKPFVTEPGKNISLKEGETLIIDCTIQDIGALPLTWKFKSGSVDKLLYAGEFPMENVVKNEESSIKGLRLIIKNVSRAHAGSYSCFIGDVLQIHNVQVKYGSSNVTIIPEREEMTVENGTRVQFICNGNGIPEPSVKWNLNDEKLPDGIKSQGKMLIIPSVTERHAGIYTCLVTNGIGKAQLKHITLVVLYKPIISPEEHKKAKKGETVELSCKHMANPPASVTWSKMDDSTGFGTTFNSTNLILKNVTEQDAGIYECLLKNHIGIAKKKIHLEISSQASDAHSTLTSQQTVELSSSSTGDQSAATNEGYSTTDNNDSLARSPTLALITLSIVVGLCIS